jgi:hypothetical protein
MIRTLLLLLHFLSWVGVLGFTVLVQYEDGVGAETRTTSMLAGFPMAWWRLWLPWLVYGALVCQLGVVTVCCAWYRASRYVTEASFDADIMGFLKDFRCSTIVALFVCSCFSFWPQCGRCRWRPLLVAGMLAHSVVSVLALLLGPRFWWDLSMVVVVSLVLARRQIHSPSVTIEEKGPIPSAVASAATVRSGPAWRIQVYADAVCLWLLATRFFFATGHANDFGTLAIGAGFVGLESFNFVGSGLLLALHTFAAEWLMLAMWAVMATLPLAAVSALDDAATTNATRIAVTRDQTTHVSSTEHVSDFEWTSNLYLGWLWLIQLHITRVVASSIMAFVLRRHLMVWAIFAPKYVFDVCKLLTVDAALLLYATLSLILTR